MKQLFFTGFIIFSIICPYSLINAENETQRRIPVFTCQVVNVYPHDSQAFTQGLSFSEGFLYEGTGLKGRSSLRMIDIETGEIKKSQKLSKDYFGEGITIYNDKIFQLTWKSGIGFIYNKNNFEQIATFSYATEGWGITHNDEELIMSDGSEVIRFLNPDTFEEIRSITVKVQKKTIKNLNELEFIEGEIYANIFGSNTIVRIDPKNGNVTGLIYVQKLLSQDDYSHPPGVLNGIAYDVENKRLFITGKLWPKLFEVTLIPWEKPVDEKVPDTQ